jgi:hypothetical protein
MAKYCAECGRQIFGSGNYCSRCYREIREHKEMFERVGTDKGKPDRVYLIKFLEIHYLCNCTWVYDIPSKAHRLKYFNMQCLVLPTWHKEMQIVPAKWGA